MPSTRAVSRRKYSKREVLKNKIKPLKLLGTQGGLTGEILEQLMEEESRNHPLGRIGTVEEVSGMIAFLASDEARFITGQIIGIDGGRALKI